MPSRAEIRDSLQALIAGGLWIEVWALLENHRSFAVSDEAATLFQDAGDTFAASGHWMGALRCYHFGMWRASRFQVAGAAAMQTIALLTKFADAQAHAVEDVAAFRESICREAIALGLRGSFASAEEILNWLPASSGPGYAASGSAFESAAETAGGAAARWLYAKAEYQYQLDDAGADASNRVRGRIDELDYPPAAVETSKPASEEPVKQKSVKKARSEGLEEVEQLAIAGRFRDAYSLLNRSLAPETNRDVRSLVAAGCLEQIADRVAEAHPKAALRLYEKVLVEYRSFAGSADTAYEGRERWGMADSVAGRISMLKDRIRGNRGRR